MVKKISKIKFISQHPRVISSIYFTLVSSIQASVRFVSNINFHKKTENVFIFVIQGPVVSKAFSLNGG